MSAERPLPEQDDGAGEQRDDEHQAQLPDQGPGALGEREWGLSHPCTSYRGRSDSTQTCRQRAYGNPSGTFHPLDSRQCQNGFQATLWKISQDERAAMGLRDVARTTQSEAGAATIAIA